MLRPQDVQTDANLSTLATEIMNLPNGPIADQILPPLDTGDKITFKYNEYGAEFASADFDDLVGTTGETNEIGHTLSSKDGTLIERGYHEVIGVDILDVQTPPVDSMEDATRTIISKLLIKREKRVEALVNDTAVLPYASPSVKWNASSGTITILKNIRTWKEAFKAQAGIDPNIMVVPNPVFSVMLEDPAVADILKHWRPELLFGSGIFPMVENMRVLIPGMQANGAQPGLTLAMGNIWTRDNVILACVNPIPSSRSFSLGWSFRRKFSNNWNAIIRTTSLPTQNAWWVEGRYWMLEKITCTNAAYIGYDVLT